MTTPKSLKARFPYQFAGKNIGISTARGWFPIFEKLCADIDLLLGEDKRSFHWTQVKEKFGSGRAYWALDKTDGPLYVDFQGPEGLITYVSDPSGSQRDAKKAELMKAIGTLVNAEMDKTSESCAVCGAPAKIDQTDGYFLVLCPKHIAQRKKDSATMDSAWFDCEEWL
jgi:hypothetical protein